MKFNLLHFYALLSLALVGAYAVSPQVYWNSVLPNTPMPKPIKDLLYTKAWDDGMEEVATNTPSTSIKLKDQPEQSYSYVASKEEVKDDPRTLRFFCLASNEEVKDNQFTQLFFLENELHQGKEIKLLLNTNDQKTAFLPKDITDSIPFSSKDLPEIYYKFSVKPDSAEAEMMKQTLSLCEHKGINREEKICATSLESMIDFATTKLGKTVKALSTEVNAKESTTSQKYTTGLIKKLAANKIVVCHRRNYAYGVFYCHVSNGVRSYAVSLEGADGTKVKSMAVCHTSKWNPEHLGFRVVRVNPGTVPVCHFLLEHTILWVPY